MVKDHLKRIATPKTWNILRKTQKFITRPNAGAHSLTHALSLNTIVKEDIQLANTTKEVKRVLKEQEVLVDGKKRHDEKYNVGFMDVINFPKIKKAYRIGFTTKGKLQAFEIPAKEAELKISRITGKSVIPKGKIQLQLSDGRTMLLDKDAYAVGDSLLLQIPTQEVKEHLALKKGASIVVYKGKYAGTEGTIEEIENNSVVVKTKNGNIHTKKQYVYVMGDKKTAIKCSP